MRKILLTMMIILGGAIHASAQCVPDVSITQPGIYPDTTTNLPVGTAGVFYSTDIQLKVITDTFASGFNVDVVNITINSVSGLPAGFSYTCTPANCVFPGGSNGCIRLFGTNATPGTYDLTVNVTLNGLVFGSFPVSQAATIEGYRIVLDAPAGPVADFSASSTSICKGESVTFTDLSANGPNSLTWSFPGGNPSASSDPNPVVNYSTPGVYSVTLTASNGNGSDQITKTNYITVNGKPDATITPGGVIKFCPGESTVLSAASDPNYTYQWYKYAVLLTGETNQNLVVSTAGNYRVKVTDQTTGCSKVSVDRLVRLHPLPNIAISAAGPTSFCSGESVNLVATTGITNTVQWTKGGVDISGATGNLYEATASGFYRAVATSQNGCSRTSTGISVKAWPLPNGGITQSGSLSICQGDSVTLSVINFDPANTYQWEESQVSIAGATGQSYAAKSAGKYTFLAESQQGCTKRSPARIVSITCREALTTLVTTLSLGIHPNPASGQVYLDIEKSESGKVVVEVFDLTGRLQSTLLDESLEPGKFTFSTDLAGFKPGIYLVKMSSGNQTKVQRLVIE